MTLSHEEVSQFNQDGFIILRNFLDSKTCEAILDKAKEALTHAIEPLETENGYDSRDKQYRTSVTDYHSHSKPSHTIRRLRQVYQRDPLFREWMENQKIRPILKQLLNDTVVLITAHHNSIMTKMPHTSQETAWHQDIRYWHYSDNNLLSVWLALGEESLANGALEFIPHSHAMTFDEKHFDEKVYFKETSLEKQNLISQKVSAKLEQGDVVLFHASLLHRANKNSTKQSKISFVYSVKGFFTKTTPNTRSSEFPEIYLN